MASLLELLCPRPTLSVTLRMTTKPFLALTPSVSDDSLIPHPLVLASLSLSYDSSRLVLRRVITAGSAANIPDSTTPTTSSPMPTIAGSRARLNATDRLRRALSAALRGVHDAERTQRIHGDCGGGGVTERACPSVSDGKGTDSSSLSSARNGRGVSTTRASNATCGGFTAGGAKVRSNPVDSGNLHGQGAVSALAAGIQFSGAPIDSDERMTTPVFPLVLGEGTVIRLSTAPESGATSVDSRRNNRDNDAFDYVVGFAAGGFPTVAPTQAFSTRVAGDGDARRHSTNGPQSGQHVDQRDHSDHRGVLYTVLMSPAEADSIAREALLGEDDVLVSPEFQKAEAERGERDFVVGLEAEALGGVDEQVGLSCSQLGCPFDFLLCSCVLQPGVLAPATVG